MRLWQRTALGGFWACLFFLFAIDYAICFDDIVRAVFKKLNDGRSGSHPAFPMPIPRVADRIVSLHVNLIGIDDIKEVLFEPVGTRTGSEKYYSFDNCGTI